jgi:hypothetical protein
MAWLPNFLKSKERKDREEKKEREEKELIKNEKQKIIINKSKHKKLWRRSLNKQGDINIDDKHGIFEKDILSDPLYQYLKKMLYIPIKCENIVLLSQEEYPTCWFNAPISGFINGVYSSIILKAKLIEYLKKNQVINLNENTCYKFDKDKDLLYSFIYTCYTKSRYITNSKEKLDIETFRKGMDLQHDLPTTPSGVHGGGGAPFETLDKIIKLLDLNKYHQVLDISNLKIIKYEKNIKNIKIRNVNDFIIFNSKLTNFNLGYEIPKEFKKDGEVYHLDHAVLSEMSYINAELRGHAFTGYLCGNEFIQTFALTTDKRHNNGKFDWRNLEKMSKEWSKGDNTIEFSYNYIVYVKKKDIDNNLNNFYLIMYRFKPGFKDLLLTGNEVKIDDFNISIDKKEDSYEIKYEIELNSTYDDKSYNINIEIYLLNFFSKQIMNLIKKYKKDPEKERIDREEKERIDREEKERIRIENTKSLENIIINLKEELVKIKKTIEDENKNIINKREEIKKLNSEGKYNISLDDIPSRKRDIKISEERIGRLNISSDDLSITIGNLENKFALVKLSSFGKRKKSKLSTINSEIKYLKQGI